MLVREFLTIQTGSKRRVKSNIKKKKKRHTFLSLSTAQCPGYTYTSFLINTRTRCEHPSPMLSWKIAIWSEATLRICPQWCERWSMTYINHFIEASNWEVNGKRHTHLPMHLTNFLSFKTWVFNALYWASCFPSSSSRFLACRTLTASKWCKSPHNRPHEQGPFAG